MELLENLDALIVGLWNRLGDVAVTGFRDSYVVDKSVVSVGWSVSPIVTADQMDSA